RFPRQNTIPIPRPITSYAKVCARLTKRVANLARDTTPFHHEQVEGRRLYARLDRNDPNYPRIASRDVVGKVAVALNGEHVSAWHKFCEPETAGIIGYRRSRVDGL